MARFRISMKVKDLAVSIDSDADNSSIAFAQGIMTLHRLYDWFDWNCIDDVIFMSGDPDTPCGFTVCSLPLPDGEVKDD